jgi:ABC-type antimicrobial peptide transport system permease subunit
VTGSIIGTALAVLLTEKLYVLMFRTAGITNFVGSLDYSKMPLPVAIVIICFFAFAYLCSRSISRVDIKQLITE